MKDPFSIAGRRFLITGGTRGIGRAISLQFARAGATVIANFVRNTEQAEHLMSLSREESLDIRLLRADLTSKKGMDQVESCIEELGPLSGFVHCAATGIHKPLSELTTRHLEWIFALNVQAFLGLVQRLRERFEIGASIVAVSSQGALQAVPYYTLVGASKGALDSMARHLAVELAPEGIRVNILAPGSVLTTAWDSMPEKDQRINEARKRSPLGHLVTPEEVALAAQFLCSDAAQGMIGHRLVVDGGAGIVQ